MQGAVMNARRGFRRLAVVAGVSYLVGLAAYVLVRAARAQSETYEVWNPVGSNLDGPALDKAWDDAWRMSREAAQSAMLQAGMELVVLHVALLFVALIAWWVARGFLDRPSVWTRLFRKRRGSADVDHRLE